jgi:hypothetical protein
MPAMWMRRFDSSMTIRTANEPRQPETGPDVHRKEVRGGKDLPMGLQELGPRHLLQPIGRGLQAVFAKDGGDVSRETS